MHIHVIPNRGSPPTILLRESYREGKKVKKRTLANLSSLSQKQVETIRRTLNGEELVPTDTLFSVSSSQHHGHVQAVRMAMKKLGFEKLIACQGSGRFPRSGVTYVSPPFVLSSIC